MLTKNIASEYGEYNIQCNGMGPGYIATAQTAPLREVQPDGSRHPFDQFKMCIRDRDAGSNWNTMPSHTHERRMEIYTYFELPEGQVVFHMCGEPTPVSYTHLDVYKRQEPHGYRFAA